MAKQGWKTSEFWLCMLVIGLSALQSSGVFGASDALAQVLSWAVAGLAAIGYPLSRAKAKLGDAQVEIARQQITADNARAIAARANPTSRGPSDPLPR